MSLRTMWPVEPAPAAAAVTAQEGSKGVVVVQRTTIACPRLRKWR